MIFAGPRADLPALYSAADAFVLPTAYETFSLVCMEAMACGVPVFATAAGGIEEYLKDRINGFRIRMDAEDIAEKLAAAFADPALMQRLRDGALATASSYGWDRIGQQYIELLREIDTEAGRRRAVIATVGEVESIAANSSLLPLWEKVARTKSATDEGSLLR